MRPPKKAIALLRWFCREDYIEEIEGDLTELFKKEYKNSPRLSRLKFAWRVIRYLRPDFMKSMKNHYPQNTFGMYRSYVKIGWRNLIKHRSFSVINLVGLTTGLTICFALLTIVNQELGFDKFHPDAGRIYRVLGEVTESTGDRLTFSRVPYSTVNLSRQISAVETTSTVIPFNGKIRIEDGNGSYKDFESRLPDFKYFTTTAVVEQAYFQLFKYQWLAGNEYDALALPNAVVITESRAKLYFNESDPHQILGRSIIYEDSLIAQVTGVVKDFEKNSDLKFTDFISNASLNNRALKKHIGTEGWSRRSMNSWMFVKINKGGSRDDVESSLNELLQKNKPVDVKLALSLEHITQMHFNSDIIENPLRTSHLPTLYALLVVGILILVLAIMNFINLNTAVYLRHIKEAAVRKIMGSSRGGLVIRFLSENLIILSIASVLALVGANPLLNIFGSYIPTGISHQVLQSENLLWIAIIFTVVVMLLSAASFKMLAAVPVAQGIKGIKNRNAGSTSLTQKVLIIFQFSISVAFIIGSLVVERQIQFIRNKDLGFNSNAIVTLHAPQGESAKLKVFATEVKRINDVVDAALEWQTPIHDNPRGMMLKINATDSSDFWVTQIAGDENYIPLYGIKILSGRNLEPTDTVKELVINEMLMEKMGIQSPVDALGEVLYWDHKPYPVVGVVEDFHTLNLHEPTKPLCIIDRADRHREIAIKLRGSDVHNLKAGLLQVEKVWHTVFGPAEFDFKFFDDSIAQLYAKEKGTETLMSFATTVVILISCIGLFGLVAFMMEGRVKEIGIRKVLGASVAGIVSLFLTDFVALVVVSVMIAAPVSYYLMNKWLNEFAFHIAMDWWLFIISGMLAVIIAIATVSFQTIKAAMTNPVNSLRSE